MTQSLAEATQCKITELSSVQRQLSVTLAAPLVMAETEKIYQAYQRKAQIKGFRPGKAPLPMVKKEYHAEVTKDALQELMRASLGYLFEDKKITPVDYPVLQEKEWTPNGELRFVITVEVKPDLTIRDYLGLKLKKESKAPGEAEVQNVIERLRDQQGVLQDKVGTTVEAHDWVMVDMELEIDGKKLPKAKLVDRVIPLGQNYLLPELESGMIGMAAMESRAIQAPFPATHSDAKLAGKTATFHVTLKAIKEKILPAVDDAFAKATGEANDLKELKAKLLSRLQQETEDLERQRLQGLAIEAILNANPFEVPQSLVMRRFDYLLRQAMQRGLQVETEEQAKTVKSELENRALQEVRTDMILDAIAVQEKISVDDAEIDARIQSLLATQGGEQQELRNYFNHAEQRARLAENLRQTKTLELIMQKAKLSE